MSMYLRISIVLHVPPSTAAPKFHSDTHRRVAIRTVAQVMKGPPFTIGTSLVEQCGFKIYNISWDILAERMSIFLRNEQKPSARSRCP